jgi:GMP synthase (glutamine-hydrolysing)
MARSAGGAEEGGLALRGSGTASDQAQGRSGPRGAKDDRAAVRSAVAIRHVAYMDLGAFEELLRARGYRIHYVDAATADLASENLLAADLLVILGAPLRLGDADKFPLLKKELLLLESRLAAQRPTLGVSLGAQLIARALGARVYPAPAPLVGWAPLVMSEAGDTSPLRHVAGPVLRWHSDLFDLPEGAELLGQTEGGVNDAFAHGPNVIAFQFHLEAMTKRFERWLVGRAPEVAAIPGLSITRLRADTARFARNVAAQGQRCLSEWLDQLRPPA